MEKIKLELLGLSPSQSQQGSFALILSEVGGSRRLPIIIGMFEAQAIAVEMERIKPNRPMTHDLFKSFALAFDFNIEEIMISHLNEGIFYAKILCSDGIRQKTVDARPSDAIAIALRFKVPIYTTSSIMFEASITSNDVQEEEEIEIEETIQHSEPQGSELKYKSLDELKKMLNELLAKEEYEEAAKIRDEIEKRN